MKAEARKTKSAKAIANVWHVPSGEPMGYCELRQGRRVLATVEAVNHRTVCGAVLSDWRYRVFGKRGAVLVERTVDSGLAAREQALSEAERRLRMWITGK